MASDTDTHMVAIPIDSAADTDTDTDTDTQQCLIAHPIAELSDSPGHLLLLKLYQREEDRIARRTGRQEMRLDGAKREAFRLSAMFVAFHSLFLTLLFVAYARPDGGTCKNWPLASVLSAVTSIVLVVSVQVMICDYWSVSGELQRDRANARALAQCVQELRMKGASFDLSKEPQATTRRARSSRVRIRWRPARWLKRNAVGICLLAVAGLLVPACRFVLCS